MSVISRIRSLETIVKGYLVGYALAISALLLLALMHGNETTQRVGAVFWVGLVIFAAAYLFEIIAVATGVPGVVAMRSMLWMVLLSLPFLVFGTHEHSDIGYAVALSMPLFYISISRTRESWTVAGMFAAAYLVGHAAAAVWVGHSPADWLTVLVKGAAIVYLGVATAMSVNRQASREDEIIAEKDRNATLNSQLQRRLTELHAVSEITEIIHSTLDFEAVGPVVIDILQKVINVTSCSLFVIDRAKAETLFSASRIDPAQAISTRTSARDLISGGSRDEHFTCIPVFDHKSMMVVFCADTAALEAMSAEDRLVLQAVASELVVAVENSQLYKLTRRLAITDELTGLHNYRYMQQRLDEEIERGRRYGKHVSLVMLDVDDFKGFNDTYGHIAGDTALADLGALLRTRVREVDVVARYGGEEFAIVLPETDATGAYVVAEKIRETMATRPFCDATGQRNVRLTVSVGLATHPAHAYDKETLLRQADDALYRAKDSGKNRVRSPHHRIQPPETADKKEATA